MMTQDRILACGLTAVLLFVLWLIALLVEVKSRTPELRSLSLTESFESVRTHVSNPVPEKIPSASSMSPPPTPEMPESMTIHRPVHMPTPRTNANPLDPLPVEPASIPLERSVNRRSAELIARSRPDVSELSINHSSRPILERPRRSTLRTRMGVSERSESVQKLEPNTTTPSDRVLRKHEEKKILEWMRITASELPPGIQRHIGYQPGNLSATAELVHQDEVWEIYLMARLPSEELHVVVVRGQATYYIVDPSFQREGRQFRMGVARRTQGEITGVTSEERPASSKDAALHYDVFLAWWDAEQWTLQ